MANIPTSPGEALDSIKKDQIKFGGFGQTSKGVEKKFEVEAQTEAYMPPQSIMVDGFITPIANRIFQNTGDNDLADRADALAYLLGGPLYEKVSAEAKCCGLDNEALFIRQFVVRDTKGSAADKAMTEAAERTTLPKRRKEDDDISNPDNQDIAEYLSPDNLGAVRGLAKTYGTTNIAALRIIVSAGLTPPPIPQETMRLKRRRDHAKVQEQHAKVTT